MPKRGALIVDDTPLNIKLLAVLMTAHGYEVKTAESAEHALVVLDTFRPAVVLLDLRLPGMDGLTLARQLRASARDRDLVIIAVTASAMKGDEEIAVAAGCDGYITKPVDTRTFPGRVAEIVAQRAASAPR